MKQNFHWSIFLPLVNYDILGSVDSRLWGIYWLGTGQRKMRGGQRSCKEKETAVDKKRKEVFYFYFTFQSDRKIYMILLA